MDRTRKAEILELLSVPSEGNVFEPVGSRGYVLRVNELGVLADAAIAIGGRLVSLEAAVNDAFAIQTRDVRDSVKDRAVLADWRVVYEWYSAAAAFFFSTGE